MHRLAIAAASLALSLAGVEILLRTKWFGEPYGSAATRRKIEEVAAALNRHAGTPDADGVGIGEDGRGVSWILHPYLGVEPENRQSRYQEQAEQLKKTRSANTYDILVVGGSVASNFTLHGGARLIELVRGDERFAGRDIRIINQGRGGYKEPQQLLLVAYLLDLGFAPDAVLNIDGFNECALGNFNAQNDTHPIYPSLAHWSFLVAGSAPDREALDLLVAMRGRQVEAERLVERADELELCSSAILGRLVLSRLQRVQREYVAVFDEFSRTAPGRASQRVLSGPPLRQGSHATLSDAALSEIERIWEESSVSLSGICAARSIDYLHVLQPTLHDAGSKPLDVAELAGGAASEEWIEGVRHGYPLLRAASAELCSRGVNFVDLSMVFRDVSEPLYHDACHFNVAGNQILAEAIAKAFLESVPSR